MRPIALTAAAALLLAWTAAPAYAGGGLPTLASIEVEAHRITVHGDSPTLHTGINTLTVDREDLDAEHTISLSLLSPAGTLIAVPLENLTVLEGPEVDHGHSETSADDHAAEGDAHSHAEAPEENTTSGSDQESPMGGTNQGHSENAAGDEQSDEGAHSEAGTGHAPSEVDLGGASHAPEQTAQVRGQVRVDEPGLWTLVVTVDGHGEMMTEQATLTAKKGGPSPLYLGATGSAMAGTILYGLIRRRQNAGRV